MSISEKHQRSCSVVRKTIRHYLRTNQFRHYRDVELFERSLPAKTDEPKESPSDWHKYLDAVMHVLKRSVDEHELTTVRRHFVDHASIDRAAAAVLGNPERLGG